MSVPARGRCVRAGVRSRRRARSPRSTAADRVGPGHVPRPARSRAASARLRGRATSGPARPRRPASSGPPSVSVAGRRAPTRSTVPVDLGDVERHVVEPLGGDQQPGRSGRQRRRRQSIAAGQVGGPRRQLDRGRARSRSAQRRPAAERGSSAGSSSPRPAPTSTTSSRSGWPSASSTAGQQAQDGAARTAARRARWSGSGRPARRRADEEPVRPVERAAPSPLATSAPASRLRRRRLTTARESLHTCVCHERVTRIAYLLSTGTPSTRTGSI